MPKIRYVSFNLFGMVAMAILGIISGILFLISVLVEHNDITALLAFALSGWLLIEAGDFYIKWQKEKKAK